MDKIYNHKEVEEKIYKSWEESGSFAPEINPEGKPFTIILPPPNANAPLHLGHAMYTVEDILVRYHRMLGDASLWVPGADHAGFETQFVFEKQLQKNDKSRFDYSREELYKLIWDFAQNNRPVMEDQLRRLGFSLDWSRKKFTLDSDVVSVVYETFKKLYDEGLIYRDLKLVNYCTKDGTSFSDLEVKHVEQKDPLYYMKYGPFVLATVRPETKFGDTGIAVHPNDKRYKDYIGQEIEFEGLTGKVKLKVVGDSAVDPEFGTGVVKVTPAHDMTDFEIGKRHNLPMKQVIGFDGKLTDLAGKYKGLKVKEAREVVVKDLMDKGLIEKIDESYTHTVGTCYKCGRVLEPLPMEQWFVKVRPLAEKGIDTIKKKNVKFVPRRFEKTAVDWLTNFHDWNISRQLVWGIRIPAWKCENNHWTVTKGEAPEKCANCTSKNLKQDSDTFDTWFSSGQWPYATLKTTKEGDFEKFYPTSIMETGYDILPWWVVRMIMLGIFSTEKAPFEIVYLHGLVRDSKGAKMSKSKGNVINPIEMMDKYSADALRMALIFSSAAGNDQSISEEKIKGMRNFANKLWNIGRYFYVQDLMKNFQEISIADFKVLKEEGLLTETMVQAYDEVIKLADDATKDIEKFNLNFAAERVYEFTWHKFADLYLELFKKNIEEQKTQDYFNQLLSLYIQLLKLLHPFMPFITEEIFGKLSGNNRLLITQKWPKN